MERKLGKGLPLEPCPWDGKPCLTYCTLRVREHLTEKGRKAQEEQEPEKEDRQSH